MVVRDLGKDDIILGRNFLRKYDVLVDVPRKQIQVRNPDLAYTVVSKVSEQTPSCKVVAAAKNTTLIPSSEIVPVEYQVIRTKGLSPEIVRDSWLALVQHDSGEEMRKLGITAPSSLCRVSKGCTKIPLLNCNQPGEGDSPQMEMGKLPPNKSKLKLMPAAVTYQRRWNSELAAARSTEPETFVINSECDVSAIHLAQCQEYDSDRHSDTSSVRPIPDEQDEASSFPTEPDTVRAREI
jgi:hypothetical protein